MSKTFGQLTLPSEDHFLEQTKEMLNRWGADAIRDSDGTELPAQIKALDAKIYTTYFVSRGHNEHAASHPEECQQLYLLSRHALARSETLEIDFLDGYFTEQVRPDYDHDPKIWWEVINRTTGQLLSPDCWEIDPQTNRLVLHKAQAFCEYTVSFLVYAIWDPTQMYNHITNSWGDKPHDIPFDIRQPASGAFAKEYLTQWLKENPETDVVRFTTFFYHFTLVFNAQAKEKFVDWFGYGASVSVAALEEFAQEYGYRLRPEDIIDNGYYNTSFRIPTAHYLDYMDFIERFVAKKAGELVRLVHAAGKEAMMFLGDNWIGTEPYGAYFEQIGLDAVVGSVGGGATLRMISEIPHVKYSEGRFLPYFFPDTFHEGGDPCKEAMDNWLCARRAMMRKPVDRIGYGGYLSLAYQFPEFVDYIESVADEFRLIYSNIHGIRPYCGLKVAILNCWGALRSWQCFMVAHALWYKQIYSYLGILESLSGMSVDVSFLSFDDIKKSGIPKGIDVILNAGDAGTAFSGGTRWLEPDILCSIRAWIDAGGGFLGVGQPSAVESGGHFFQLADALGLDQEQGFSLSTDKYFHAVTEKHFITADLLSPPDFGEGMKNIYATKSSIQILSYSNGEVHLAANDYGKGRAVYAAGLPYSPQNTRLLLRCLFYAAHKEDQFQRWYAENLFCELHAYPDAGKYAVLNNSDQPQTTTIFDGEGKAERLQLQPGEIVWKASSPQPSQGRHIG